MNNPEFPVLRRARLLPAGIVAVPDGASQGVIDASSGVTSAARKDVFTCSSLIDSIRSRYIVSAIGIKISDSRSIN